MWVKDKKYQFDYCDITTLICIVAVIFTICGYPYITTILFIINCCISIILIALQVKRFNLLFLQIALLILNIYYLM